MKLRERRTTNGTSYFLDYRLDGRRFRERLQGIHDRKTAELYLAQRRLEIARGVAGLPRRGNLTVGAALDVYLAEREATCSAGHLAVLRPRVRELKEAFGASTPLRTITHEALNTWRKNLLGAGQAPPTVNKKCEVLRAAARRAHAAGLIPDLPLLRPLQRVSDPRREAWRWLTEEEIDRLLAVLAHGAEREVKRRNGRNYTAHVAGNVKLWRAVVFLLNSGARLGEMQALRWKDIDLGRGFVTFYTGKHGGRGARKRARHVPMNAVLRSMLEEVRAERKTAPADAAVFHYPNGFRRDLQAACLRAGLGHVRPHDLRHTFASHLAIRGVPLNTIRELLGHASMAMTLRYAHLSPAARAEAVEALNFGRSGEAVGRVMAIGGGQ